MAMPDVRKTHSTPNVPPIIPANLDLADFPDTEISVPFFSLCFPVVFLVIPGEQKETEHSKFACIVQENFCTCTCY